MDASFDTGEFEEWQSEYLVHRRCLRHCRLQR